MTAVRLVAVASIAVILLTAVDTSRAYVSPATYPLGTMTWTLVSAPRLQPMGSCLEFSYENNLNTTSEGFVYAVVRNSIGQTLLISAVFLANFTVGSVDTICAEVWEGVGPGNYTASIFATSMSEVSISNSTSVSYSF